MNDEQRNELQRRIGYTFRDPGLLQEAMTHSSFANEQSGGRWQDNERLEFLGDAILGLVIAETLFDRYPDMNEGELSKFRAQLINSAMLAQLARALDIGPFLLVGRGEGRSGGRDRDNLLADALEAVFGAIYLEAGVDAVRPVILNLYSPTLSRLTQDSPFDFKTVLQEKLQRSRRSLPSYVLITEEGPAHQKLFTVELRLDGQVLGSGSGRSKKEAEQAAAALALKRLAG